VLFRSEGPPRFIICPSIMFIGTHATPPINKTNINRANIAATDNTSNIYNMVVPFM